MKRKEKAGELMTSPENNHSNPSSAPKITLDPSTLENSHVSFGNPDIPAALPEQMQQAPVSMPYYGEVGTSRSIKTAKTIGWVFAVLGVVFLIACLIFTVLFFTAGEVREVFGIFALTFFILGVVFTAIGVVFILRPESVRVSGSSFGTTSSFLHDDF